VIDLKKHCKVTIFPCSFIVMHYKSRLDQIGLIGIDYICFSNTKSVIYYFTMLCTQVP